VLYVLLKHLVLPPGLILLLLLGGLAIMRRWPRLGVACCLLAGAGLYLVSAPAGTRLLAGDWERVPLFDPAAGAGALVVLGGGRDTGAPEYPGTDAVSMYTLVRLRYAAYLHRRTGLPVLVSGGRVLGSAAEPEAQLMARALRRDFGIPVRWLEQQSRDTYGNARHSAALLRPEGIDTIALVTHAVHMRRARRAFEHAGLQVVPAPTYFLTAAGEPLTGYDFIPSSDAFLASRYVLHERLGALWYRLRRLLDGDEGGGRQGRLPRGDAQSRASSGVSVGASSCRCTAPTTLSKLPSASRVRTAAPDSRARTLRRIPPPSAWLTMA